MSWLKDLIRPAGVPTLAEQIEQAQPGDIIPVYPLQQYGLGYTATTSSNSLRNSQASPFQQALNNAAMAPGSWTNINANTIFGSGIRTLRSITAAHLAAPVFQANIDDLVNAWLAKFGDAWVRREQIFSSEDPEFFELAAQRMMKAGRLEEHTLMDTMDVVYRVVER